MIMKLPSMISLVVFAATLLMSACAPGGEFDGVGMNSNIEQVAETEFDECKNPEFTEIDRGRCEFRRKNCYGAMNSESVVCKRSLQDLVFRVRPAELVEIDGLVLRDGNTLYLAAGGGEAPSPRIEIVSNSCDSDIVKEMCSYKNGEKVTVVGAYYSENDAPKENPYERPLGKILVLNIYPGGRNVPQPVK